MSPDFSAGVRHGMETTVAKSLCILPSHFAIRTRDRSAPGRSRRTSASRCSSMDGNFGRHAHSMVKDEEAAE